MKEKLLKFTKSFKYYYNKIGLNIHYFITKYDKILLGAIIVILSLVLRYSATLFPTNDVVGYVFNWMKQIENVGFKNFYTINADYSPLYLFIVGLFTFFPKGAEITLRNFTFYENWMYYVKSMFFLMDILIAIGVYLNIKLLTSDKTKAFIGFIITLCLPVQFFNSAIWGNSDSIYFACFIYIIYFILKRKDNLAFLLLGVAFGFKLQASFILPFMILLIFLRRLKFHSLLFLPLGLVLTFVPAYLCGASFSEPFMYISRQLTGYNKLTLGCANIWHLINVPESLVDMFNPASTILGLILIGLFMAIIYLRKIDLTDQNVFYIGVFLISIVPLFLPHMHERYFYSLDILVVLYCLIKKEKYYFIPLMQLSSGIAYHNYLAGRHFILSWGEDSVHIASWINIFVITLIFIDLLKLNHSTKTKKEDLEQIKKEISTLTK